MFHAGIYCRVSVEEAVKVDKYSNSIHSQVKMGQEYISEQQDITFVSSYLDDGISGSNFVAPVGKSGPFTMDSSSSMVVSLCSSIWLSIILTTALIISLRL